MARQTTNARGQERDREVERTSRRVSGPQEVATRCVQQAPSIQRLARSGKDAQNLKTAKVRQTISAAGVVKKKAKANTRDKKHHRRREPTPEPDFMSDLRDGIETARDALNANAKSTFDDIHAALSARLLASKSTDEAFFQYVTENANTLGASLVQEKVETIINKNGKRKTEIVEIGNRVATFKKFIEKEDVKLNDQWKQWDAIQTEYVELGIDVFGPEVFGEAALGLKRRAKGFKREMELLNLEHDTRVGEFDEEIEAIGVKMLQKMNSSEKELEVEQKKEQTRLLEAIMRS